MRRSDAYLVDAGLRGGRESGSRCRQDGEQGRQQSQAR
jgi:hypothetical protein